jgi:hypothetical protein
MKKPHPEVAGYEKCADFLTFSGNRSLACRLQVSRSTVHRIVRQLIVTAALAGLGSLAAGCEGMPSPLAPTPSTPTAASLSADAGFCVDEINRLRATVGAPPLVRDETVEAFSNDAAEIDGGAHEVHKHFRDTSGGNGVSRAENEIPWWSLYDWGSVRTIVRRGLAQEWGEGPGGGHYDNMTGAYSAVACGISIKSGEVTITQDFR